MNVSTKDTHPNTLKIPSIGLELIKHARVKSLMDLEKVSIYLSILYGD